MNITGIILAGGKSSRMGEDKCFVQLSNKYFIDFIIETFLQYGICDIIINSNSPFKFSHYPYPICVDVIPEKGPLGGIYSALKMSNNEENIIIPCDSPFITPELIDVLIQTNKNHKITFPKLDGIYYPLIGCYKKSAIHFIKSLLDKNELKAQNLINYPQTSILNFSEDNYGIDDIELVFANINDKKSLQYYEENVPC